MPLEAKKINNRRWYAVETAFFKGRRLASRPCFDPQVPDDARGIIPGTCDKPHWEEPMNSCQKFLDGLLEVNVDWFQTKEQAEDFMKGRITYIIHMEDEYRANINSTISHFIKWETILVADGLRPYRGVYVHHKRPSL